MKETEVKVFGLKFYHRETSGALIATVISSISVKSIFIIPSTYQRTYGL